MMITEFPTRRKDELVALGVFEVSNKLIQISGLVTEAEVNVQDIMVTMRRNLGENRLHVDITSAPTDNVPFYFKTSDQKWKCVLQRWTASERKLGK